MERKNWPERVVFERPFSMTAADLIVVASNYRVIALSKTTGDQIWETMLIPVFFKVGDSFVSVAVDDTGVYAHTSNQMFRLNLLTGEILWQKKLPSLRGLATPSIAFLGMTSSASTPSFANNIRRTQSDG